MSRARTHTHHLLQARWSRSRRTFALHSDPSVGASTLAAILRAYVRMMRYTARRSVASDVELSGEPGLTFIVEPFQVRNRALGHRRCCTRRRRVGVVSKGSTTCVLHSLQLSARRQSTCRVAVVCLFRSTAVPDSHSTNNVVVGKRSVEQGSAERKSGRVSHAMTAESIVLQKGARERESGARGHTTTSDNENNKTTKTAQRR